MLAWIDVANDGNNPNAPIIPFFSAFLAVWTTVLLVVWRRRQSKAILKWGCTDYQAEETSRTEFEGECIESPINASKILYFSSSDFALRIFASSLFTFGILIVVLIAMRSLFIIKILLRSIVHIDGFELGSILIPILQTLLMLGFDYLYSYVSIWMNDFENHRIESEYEDGLIIKTFLFRFVNNYTPLFYIAFVKPFILEWDPCTGNDCMKELQISLGVIFITKLLLNMILSIAKPIHSYHVNRRLNFKGKVQLVGLYSQLYAMYFV